MAATTKPWITKVKLSKTSVKTKEVFTVTVVAIDSAYQTTDAKYARSTKYEAVAGQQIGVL